MSVVLRAVQSRATGERRIAAFRAGTCLGYVDFEDLQRGEVIGSVPILDLSGHPLLSEMQFDAVSRARAERLRAGAEAMARTRKPLTRALQMEMRDKASTMIAGTAPEKEQAREKAGRIKEWAREHGVEDLKVPDL